MRHKYFYVQIGKSILSKYIVYFAGLISLMILSRSFQPIEFGTIAAVSTIIFFINMLIEAGIVPAIINLEKISESERNGIFSFTLILGLCLFALYSVSGSLIEEFYGIENLSYIVPIMGISILSTALGMLPNAQLLREQKYRIISICGLCGEVGSLAIVILASYKTDPILALCLKIPASAIIVNLGYWIYTKDTDLGRAKPGGSIRSIRVITRFSSYQFGFNLVNYFSRNLDSILIGRNFGAQTLGYYDKAYQLMKYPLLLLTFAMTPAIQPVVKDMRNDLKAAEQLHQSFLLKLSMIAVLVGIGIHYFSESIVSLILGSQWANVGEILKILSLAIPVQIVLSTSGSFFQALNRPDLLFLSGCLSALVMISAIVIGLYHGSILAISWMIVIAFHVNFVQAYYILYKRIFRRSFKVFLFKMIGLPIYLLGVTYFFVERY